MRTGGDAVGNISMLALKFHLPQRGEVDPLSVAKWIGWGALEIFPSENHPPTRLAFLLTQESSPTSPRWGR